MKKPWVSSGYVKPNNSFEINIQLCTKTNSENIILLLLKNKSLNSRIPTLETQLSLNTVIKKIIYDFDTWMNFTIKAI